ncbi:MAG: GNAT family N-acetyltransferase [Bacteroidota bacterium]
MSANAYTYLKNIQIPAFVSYFDPRYLTLQEYNNLKCFEDKNYLILFSINHTTANSISNAPFGSFVIKKAHQSSLFGLFEDKIFSLLKKTNIKKINIKHPSSIYRSFVDIKALQKVGYKVQYEDINQHISLTADWKSSIHKMELRKLKNLKLKGFEFRKMPESDLEKAHQFLTTCREAQGLQINISWKKLASLIKEMPKTYDCFGVFRQTEMTAVCITVRVSSDIAYYYLPGTSPFFRAQSPMVLLIEGMASYYKDRGFSYLDLGVSSILGKAQETLRIFKKRMGATETTKPTLVKFMP